MKKKVKYIDLFNDLISIVLLALAFSVVYTLIVFGNFNFVETAKNKSNQSLKKDFQEISIDEAQNLFNKAIVIDARSEVNYFNEHIPGAINISVNNFDNYIDKIFEFPKDTLLIVYCEGVYCNLGHQLAEKLKALGFSKIMIMFEGIEGWKKRKLPLVK